jgi:hypothetical protein
MTQSGDRVSVVSRREHRSRSARLPPATRRISSSDVAAFQICHGVALCVDGVVADEVLTRC